MKKINFGTCNNSSDFHYIFLTSQAFHAITVTISFLLKNTASSGAFNIYIRDYKYLSWVYDVDRKICHKGH